MQLARGRREEGCELLLLSLRSFRGAENQLVVALAVEGLAIVAQEEGRDSDGAQLWGYADRLRSSLVMPLTQDRVAERDHHLRQARARLGDDEVDRGDGRGSRAQLPGGAGSGGRSRARLEWTGALRRLTRPVDRTSRAAQAFPKVRPSAEADDAVTNSTTCRGRRPIKGISMSQGNVSTLTAPATDSCVPAPGATADLVRAAAQADADAWKTIIERYTKTVHRIARAHRLSDADASDVAQTVWLRLLENIGRLRDPERVGGWVSTTARYECLRLCRQRGRVRLVHDAAILDAMQAEPDPAPPAETHDRDAALCGAVATLPPRQRAILNLLMAEPPLSYGDIATSLNIPIGSIGPTRRRGLQTLRVKCLSADVLPG